MLSRACHFMVRSTLDSALRLMMQDNQGRKGIKARSALPCGIGCDVRRGWGCGLRQNDLARKYDFYDLSNKSDPAAWMQTGEFKRNGLRMKFGHDNLDKNKSINH